jgi:uncharacterized protein (TIGR03435 family)
MSGNVDPGFEVATIKPSEPGRPGKLFTVRGQDIVTINTTLNDLITMAYGIHAKQITGGPSWLDSEKYDLTIKPDAPGQPNVAQMKIIIQKLLARRAWSGLPCHECDDRGSCGHFAGLHYG